MNDEERTPEPDADTEAREPRTEPTAVLGQTQGQPRRLMRSRDDRMVTGVAGGLADYFSVDPVIVRIAFAVSVFFGGLGALAYLALTLFVPAQPGPADGDRPLAPVERSRWLGIAAGVVIGVVALSAAGSLFFWEGTWGWDGGGPWGLLLLIAVGAGAYAVLRDREPSGPRSAGRTALLIVLAMVAAAGLFCVAVLSAFAGATGSGEFIAVLVIAIGVLLAGAAFAGGARWLIAPALALAVPLGVVTAADISFAGGVGDRVHRPTSAAALEDRYEHGVGRMVVDLRGLDWADDTAVPLEVDLGVGEAVVVVPEDVCVAPDLHVGAGQIQLGNGNLGGVDLDEHPATGAARGPSLELDGEVDLGALRVLTSYEAHHGPPFGRFDQHREDRARVC